MGLTIITQGIVRGVCVRATTMKLPAAFLALGVLGVADALTVTEAQTAINDQCAAKNVAVVDILESIDVSGGALVYTDTSNPCAITLQSAGTPAVVTGSTSAFQLIRTVGSDVTIKNLRFDGGSKTWATEVLLADVKGGKLTMMNCLIEDFTSPTHVAGVEDGDVHIDDMVFDNSDARCLSSSRASNVRINNVVVDENSAFSTPANGAFIKIVHANRLDMGNLTVNKATTNSKYFVSLSHVIEAYASDLAIEDVTVNAPLWEVDRTTFTIDGLVLKKIVGAQGPDNLVLPFGPNAIVTVRNLNAVNVNVPSLIVDNANDHTVTCSVAIEDSTIDTVTFARSLFQISHALTVRNVSFTNIAYNHVDGDSDNRVIKFAAASTAWEGWPLATFQNCSFTKLTDVIFGAPRYLTTVWDDVVISNFTYNANVVSMDAFKTMFHCHIESDVTLRGVTIRDGEMTGAFSNLMNIESPTTVVEDCVFQDLKLVMDTPGPAFIFQTGITVKSTKFDDMTLSYDGGSASLISALGDLDLQGCVVSNIARVTSQTPAEDFFRVIQIQNPISVSVANTAFSNIDVSSGVFVVASKTIDTNVNIRSGTTFTALGSTPIFGFQSLGATSSSNYFINVDCAVAPSVDFAYGSSGVAFTGHTSYINYAHCENGYAGSGAVTDRRIFTDASPFVAPAVAPVCERSCLSCFSGYELRNGKCVALPTACEVKFPGCAQCNKDNTECNACAVGFEESNVCLEKDSVSATGVAEAAELATILGICIGLVVWVVLTICIVRISCRRKAKRLAKANDGMELEAAKPYK